MYQIELDSQPIALCQLLKAANLVGGGGEAKIVISEGYVSVNNEICLLKRKKIYHGDVIEFNGDVFEIICHQMPTDKAITATKPQPSSAHSKNRKTKPVHKKSKQKNKAPTPNNNKQGRRPISF